MATGFNSGLRPATTMAPPPTLSWQAQLLKVCRDSTRKQRMVTVAVVTAVLTLWLVGTFILARMAFQPLYAFKISVDDLQDITMHLDRNSYRYEVDGDRIMVSPGERQRLVQWLADEYNLPHQNVQDKKDDPFFPMPGPPDHRAEKERQLSRLVDSFTFVQDCRVMLTLPDPDSPTSQTSQAAIQVTLRPGMRPDSTQVEGLVGQVLTAVPGLTREHVRVVDQNSVDLYRPQSPESNGADDKATQEKALADKVRQLLDPELGPANYTIGVNVDIDKTSKRIDVKEVTPGQPTQRDVTSEVYHGVDKSGKSGQGDYTHSRDSSHSSPGSIERVTVVPPGTLRRLTASLAINRRLSIEQIASYQLSVENAIGAEESRGDQVTVRSATFWTPPLQVPVADEPSGPLNASYPWALGALSLLGLLTAGAAGLVWASRQPVRNELALTPTGTKDTVLDSDIVDLHRGREGKTTPRTTDVAPRQSLEALAARHPKQVAQLLSTWLRQEA